MCGSSKLDTSLNSDKSKSVTSSPECFEPLFQFSTSSPQTTKMLATVAAIRSRRDRNIPTQRLNRVDLVEFRGCEVLFSVRDCGAICFLCSGAASLIGIATGCSNATGCSKSDA